MPVQAPKYAPGGTEDRLYRINNNYNRTPTPEKKNKTRPLLIILGLVLIVILFGATVNPQPLSITNQTTALINESTVLVSFQINNDSIGMVFKPTYTILIQDLYGNTVYSKTTEAASYMMPKSKQQISETAPGYPGYNYSIQLQWETLLPA